MLVDAIKRSEDRSHVVLRLHEYAGSQTHIRVDSAYSIASWQECNLLEEPQGDWQADDMVFQIKPYEIKTFRIHMGNGQK
ncbi:hypothetical protein D3C75_1288540 [compost metagenome]